MNYAVGPSHWASRSANAAKEINSLTNESVERVEEEFALGNRTSTTMTEVLSSIRCVSTLDQGCFARYLIHL